MSLWSYCCVLSQEQPLNYKFINSKINEFNYKNLDSLRYYFSKLEDIYLQKSQYNYAYWTKISLLYQISYFYNHRLYKEALEDIEHFLNTNSAALSKDDYFPLMNYTYQYMDGLFYYEIGDLKSAKETTTHLIQTYNSLSDDFFKDPYYFDLISKSYMLIIDIYKREQKYELVNLTLENLNFIVNKYRPNDPELNSLINFLHGKVLSSQNRFLESNTQLIKAFNYTLVNNVNLNRLASIGTRISTNYIKLNKPDSARYYLNTIALKLDDNHPFWEEYYQEMAKLEYYESNEENAVNLYLKAAAIAEKKWQDNAHPEVLQNYLEIGKLYAIDNSANLALEMYDRIITIIKAKSDTESTLLQTLYLNTLIEKLKLNYKTKTRTALRNSKTAVSILDNLKNQHQDDKDKFNFIDRSYSLFNAINTALFYADTDSVSNEDVFYFFEKSKANILLDGLKVTYANQYANVPDSVISKEYTLNLEISSLEKIRDKQPENSNKLLNLKNEYNDFIVDLEVNYPNYYDLKYNSDVISLKAVQRHLKRNQALISYFYGPKYIYSISVTKTKTYKTKIQLTEALELSLISYYNLLKNPVETADINDLAKDLLTKLLEPHRRSFDDAIDDLIIIPDGNLNYLPFESLKFQDGTYLIEKYSVLYSNSATLLFNSESKSQTNTLMAFAPDFKLSTLLNDLPNAKTEAAGVAESFKGDIFTDSLATKTNFLRYTPQYNIFHLATHAIYNDAYPDNSYLAFDSFTSNDNKLYVNEIYNLNLSNVNMLTLSACSTGFGELKKGEGFISLARAFFYSGVKSITSTLWSINDNSSSKIMASYYDYLNQGKSKSKALQQAKLDFLNSYLDTELAHPYYWSSFIVSGNNEPLVKNNSWMAYILGVFSAFIIVYFSRKKLNVI